MLTDEETRVAAYAFALHLEGKAFAVHDEYLPSCERLRERGWLTREMQDGEPVYELTQSGRVALETPPTRQPAHRERELMQGSDSVSR